MEKVSRVCTITFVSYICTGSNHSERVISKKVQLTLTELKLPCIRSLDQRERRLEAWRGAGSCFCPYWEGGRVGAVSHLW
jgi:hypothetical protein